MLWPQGIRLFTGVRTSNSVRTPKGRLWLPGLGWGQGGHIWGAGGGTFGGGRGSCSPCSPPAPDYKNNILKERAELVHSPPPPKNIDLDKGESR